MEEIKVKCYGLIDFTKKDYFTLQFFGFTFLILMFILSFFYDLDDFMFGHAKILIIICMFLETLETFFMYRKFREKERLLK